MDRGKKKKSLTPEVKVQMKKGVFFIVWET